MIGELSDWIGETVKITYDDDGELRALRGKLTKVFGFVELELPDGHKFLVSLGKIDRILEIDEDRLAARATGRPTVIE